MTEVEWLDCTDLFRMLWFLQTNKVWDRKLQLLAAGYCRRYWHLYSDERYRRAVLTAELFADGRANQEELIAAWEAASELSYAKEAVSAESFAARMASAASAPIALRSGTIYSLGWEVAFAVARIASAEIAFCTDDSFLALLRDVVGRLPFRSFSLNSSLLNSTVRCVAQKVYDDRAFDDPPVLADAVEEAGCTDAEILSHCRQPAPHIRGCWVVDLILGKE